MQICGQDTAKIFLVLSGDGLCFCFLVGRNAHARISYVCVPLDIGLACRAATHCGVYECGLCVCVCVCVCVQEPDLQRKVTHAVLIHARGLRCILSCGLAQALALFPEATDTGWADRGGEPNQPCNPHSDVYLAWLKINSSLPFIRLSSGPLPWSTTTYGLC